MRKIGILVVLLAACTSSDDGAVQGAAIAPLVMTRPPTVPADYVPTPNGWFHPSCVVEVRDGERVQPDGAVARADGSISRAAAPCAHTAYDVNGAPRIEHVPAGGSGWIEDGDVTNIGAVSYVSAVWQVPGTPAYNSSQTVYFFPGLMSTDLNSTIMQPVLGWNQPFGNGRSWTLESWNCCNSGTTYHSTAISVTGTTVSGEMAGSSCNPTTGICSTWTITTRNGTSGTSTVLSTTAGQAQTEIYGGVLEGYNIEYCDSLPPAGTDVFSSFSLKDASGASLAVPSWNPHYYGFSPACNYSVTHTASTLTLNWSPNLCTPGDERECCPYANGCSCPGDQTCGAGGTWEHCMGATQAGHVCP